MTVAFALSGGANLGPMQAGAVTALLEAGITPDLLVGSSVGALNSGFLASRPGLAGARALEEAWVRFRRREAFRFSLAGAIAGFVGLRDHLLSTERLRTTIRRWVQFERIEDAAVRLAVVATDALSGAPVVIEAGDAVEALVASAAIPGIFPAVRYGEHWLVDGTLSAGCPALQAQELGADTVYVITTKTAPRRRPPRGAVAMAMHTVSLVTAARTAEQLATAHRRAERAGTAVFVVPTGEPEAPGPFDFRHGRRLFDAAYRRAARWLEERSGSPRRLEARETPTTPVAPAGTSGETLSHAKP